MRTTQLVTKVLHCGRKAAPTGAHLSRWVEAGVSLVETMVSTSIVFALAAIAVPSFSNLLLEFRERSISSAFTAGIQLTRSEAIKRNSRVVMCKSSNGVSCTNTGGWDQGWIIFHDANSNVSVDPGDVLIRAESLQYGNIRLVGNSPVANYISFTGLGLPKMASGEFQAGTVTLCHLSSTPSDVRKIVLSKPGNVRLYKSNPAPCG